MEHALSLRGACTEREQNVHRDGMELAQSVHGKCAKRALKLHRVCTDPAQSVHTAQAVHGPQLIVKLG